MALHIIRSSLEEIENIAIQRSLSSSRSGPPPPPPPPPLAHPPIHQHAQQQQQQHPPPLPPKPPRMTKPAIPPRPSANQQSVTTRQQLVNNTNANRSRGNSVSFAEQTSDHEISDDGHGFEDDDDDDDDDDMVDFDSKCIFRVLRGNQLTYDPIDTSSNDKHDNDSSNNGNLLTRPHTVADTYSYMPMADTRPRSLTASAHPTPSSTDNNNTRTTMEPIRLTPVDVLSGSVIDASMLVPAQTHTGDSLAPPTAPSSSSETLYVPNIPVPPLLTTHRRLQSQLDELESSLNECKARRRAQNTGVAKDMWTSTSQELDDRILQQTAAVAETRETLNRVRTLYMSAATVPNVMQFPPHLVAYQLTLIECALFRAIPPDALLTHSTRTPHAKVVASTDFFNYITRAIEHSILLPQEAARRAELVNRWIKIASKCLALNNYQTLKAIVSALGTPPVQRLRRTWDCIPKKRMGRLDVLNSLMSETDNYGQYREHMGLNEKSSNRAGAVRRRWWNKPVVPFLGVFIHDMTYLLTAAKHEDPRVQDIIALIHHFQRVPPYPQHPPSSYVKKSGASRKHAFRPSAITHALHRSTSSKGSNTTSAGATTTTGITASSLFDMDPSNDPSIEIKVEQQLITQYLLMRPWVHEKIIDELSVLREPPKQRTIGGYGRSLSSGGTSYNNTHSNAATPSSMISATGTSSYASSILSNASSLVRLGSSYSTNTTASSFTSWEGENDVVENKQRLGGFWPFRKSSEMVRPHPTMMQSDVCVDGTTTTHTSHPWTTDGEEDEEDEEHDGPSRRPSARAIARRRRSGGKTLSGHVRSISLPSTRPESITGEDLHSKRP